MLHKILLSSFFIVAVAAAAIGAAIVYGAIVLITGELFVDLTLSAVAFCAICFSLTRGLAVLFAPGRPNRIAAAVTFASAFALAAAAAFPTLRESLSPAPNNASDGVVSALRGNTVAIQTVQAGSGFDDLQPLQSVLEGKRIVALGEATHGTSEFFKMKHRMLEFLAREMGYENFGMETGSETAQAINQYITGGDADLRKVLYWPWATQEVLDMLDWMRAYNADPKTTHKLTFYGIDPISGDRDRVMAENVARLLDALGPDGKIVLWAHNAHISNSEGRMGYYLKQKFGDQAYLAGFEFNQGAFTSRMLTIHTYRVGPASPAYYAYALAKTGEPILFLDFKTMAQNPGLREWLEKGQSSHDFQELHAIFRLDPAWCTKYTSWLQLYDGLFFIEKSTPAVGLG